MLALLLSCGTAATKEELIHPAVLSDFISSRQSRNISLTGQNDLRPLIGQYYRRPLVNLLQAYNPTVLNFRNIFFRNFDGIVLKGEPRALARYPDINIKDCHFYNANVHPIHIDSPNLDEDKILDQIYGVNNELNDEDL